MMAEISIGVVSLGIQVCQGLLQYYGSWKDSRKDVAAMCTSVESLSNTLSILEKTITGASEPDTNAQKCIEACSSSIKQLEKKLSKVKKVSGDKLSTKIHDNGRRLLYPFRESTLVKLKEIVSDVRSNLCLAIVTTHLEMTYDMSQQISDLATHIHERHRDLQGRTIIDWLSPLNFHEAQIDTLSRRQSGTCEWIFDTPEYQAWLTGGSQVLWCWGQPGAGKTILASTIIDRLVAGQMLPNVAVVFVYCYYKERESETFPALVASLVQQLVQCSNTIPKAVRHLFDQCQLKNTSPTKGQMTALFRSLLATFTRTYIVVDGLDECFESDETRTRSNFIKFLNSLPTQVGILCTSRHLGDIEEGFKTASSLEVRANDGDVEGFLRSQILGNDRLRSFCASSDGLQDTIVEKLVKSAEGMFLLAKLHVESLKTKTSPKQVRKALEILPKELNDMYDEAMERITGQSEEEVKLAMNLLSWVMHALSPLRVAELQHAVAVMDLDPDENTLSEEDLPTEAMMITVCGGLAVVDFESQVFRLVHYTTEEYFSNCLEERFPDALRDLSKCCIRYMSLDWNLETTEFDFGVNCNDVPLQPQLEHELLNYVADNWGIHARGTVESDIDEEIFLFLSNETLLARIRLATKERFHFTDVDYQEAGIVEAAAFGLAATVNKMLESGVGVSTRGYKNRTALHVAVSGGHPGLVQLLLESGADTEAIDIDGRSALFNAVLSNQLVMVQLLVEGKSDLEFKEGSTLETALHKSVWSAAASDVAKLVDLPPKQKIFTDDHPQRTQISAVTRDKAFEIIKYLLQQGADIETRNVLGETPLFDATSYGSAATVSLLVEHGANTKVYDLDSVTPLHISAEQGLLGLANLLLDSGAVLEARDSCGQTAIHVAAKHGHHLLVRRLLERGACIHALNSRSMSALHVAAQAKAQRSPEIIQLLLENGSNVEALDSRGRTAYIVAAEKGNRRNFEEFLKIRRKSVPESISEGSIPFHRAINVPEDSLPSFIDINAKDINGRTCFFVASINNNASLMKTLAEKGACVDAPDSEGQTPLHFVANYSYGGERIVRMLLELGADVNARNCSGEVPLHIAAVQGNYQMSELLVDASADTYIKDDSGKTAVEAAIQAKGQCHFCSDPHNNHDLCHDGIIKLLKVGYRRLSMDSRFQIE